MNTTVSTTITQDTTTQYGHLRTGIHSEVMDNSTDGQKQPYADKATDSMDTTLDSTVTITTAESTSNETSRSSNQAHTTPREHYAPTQEENEHTPPYLLCKHAHPPLEPSPSQDLLTLYSLNPLVSSVARTDPNTGEKINKMRKSYEGKVKTFGLAGRNRAVKQEEDKPGSLLSLIRWPDEEWQSQKVTGKDVRLGLSGATLAKLEGAMKMEPGAVPENGEWEYLLGVEKPKPMPLVAEHSKKAPQQNVKVNGKLAAVGTPNVNEAIRPKRSGRKRRYDEHSFEGYGEGYVDDDGDVTGGGGYSSGDGSRRSSTSKKKRKKDYGPISAPIVSERTGSYGVGMIGAYGQ